MTDSLHAAGWRQGTIFQGSLPLPAITMKEQPPPPNTASRPFGTVARRWRAWGTRLFGLSLSPQDLNFDELDEPTLTSRNHNIWCVATQECDLDQADTSDLTPVVEIRPVFTVEPPEDWGLRSRKLKLTAEHFIDSDSPRVNISPAALMAFTTHRLPGISNDRALALKTWLGLRYDRPAVPPEWLELSSSIADRIARKKDDSRDQVHDVLVQFEVGEPPQFYLYVVITENADSAKIRRWIADAISRVPVSLGVMGGLEVGTKSEVPLDLIENSYSADLKKITWRGESPKGAI